MLKILVVIGLVIISSVGAFALYPEKSSYPFSTRPLDIYVGVSIGTTVSDTFGKYSGSINGDGNKDRYNALWLPTKMLESGLITGNVGIRFLDSSSNFVSNFRLEAEVLYMYNWNPKIVDNRYFTANVDTEKLPTKGQEVLKKAGALKVFYDFRHWSEIAYPYISGGVGIGTFKYLFYDLEQQPNGFGEQYHGDKNLPFWQASLGFAYNNKIIKSTFFIEYKAVRSMGKIHLTPSNNGIRDKQDEVVIPPGYVSPKARDVNYFNHGLVVGLHYYLF